MLFNSYIFIFIFLPITFFIYFYLNKKNLITQGKIFLVLSSLFFYSWWNVIYLPLILISIVINYYIGKFLLKNGSSKKKKFVLTAGITLNLSLLGYFKYADFFIENFNSIFDANHTLLHLALPLAISFFTFQQISYLVDSYREETREYDFLNYTLFVTFFPQLIAGPIVHHKEMMPQFAKNENRYINYYNINIGLFIFAIGLFKKVIIADTFSTWATTGFDTATTLNLVEAWVTSLSYTFQLYFDFSGYTDMAIGVALLFNIKLPTNFNSPYKATNIQDFWRRWHMTLSRFLKDYIYIPLGGNRKGELMTYANLMITFILGGLWHGAGWTFVFWGFLHGIALVIHRIWSKLGLRLWSWIGWLITFNFINIAWVFFRAKEWDDATKVLQGMFSFDLLLPTSLSHKLAFLTPYGVQFGGFIENVAGNIYTIVWLIAAFALILFFKNSNQLIPKKLNLSHALFSSILLIVAIYSLGNKSEFLYFNF
jgi:D-alanyl-lipoteichoic acid acyltransferase DltB (MBOAT superfamily)